MSTFVEFGNFADSLLKGYHDFDSNVYKLALTNTVPAGTEMDFSLATFPNPATLAGYPSGGITMTNPVIVDNTATSAEIRFDTVTVTASGGTMGPFKTAIVYNSSNNKLLGYVSFAVLTGLEDGNALLLKTTGQNYLRVVSIAKA